MKLLHILNAILSFIFFIRGINLFVDMRLDIIKLIKEEIIAVAITLLFALNTFRSLIIIFGVYNVEVRLIEICYIGSSLFQCLMAHFIINYTSNKYDKKYKKQNKIKKDIP